MWYIRWNNRRFIFVRFILHKRRNSMVQIAYLIRSTIRVDSSTLCVRVCVCLFVCLFVYLSVWLYVSSFYFILPYTLLRSIVLKLIESVAQKKYIYYIRIILFRYFFLSVEKIFKKIVISLCKYLCIYEK